MDEKPVPVTTILLSGGMDSMACLHFYLASGVRVAGLFIDYAHRSAERERAAARNVATHYGIPFSVVEVGGLAPLVSEKGFIMGRNMAFVLLALMNVREESGAIALGIHSGTAYSDCSPAFVDLAQQVCDLYTEGRMKVEAPFVTWSKAHIAIYCLKNRLPRWLTYSCELGADQPCGRCNSCKDLIVLDGDVVYSASNSGGLEAAESLKKRQAGPGESS
jgi:7-cyano-7-deazaguanine synthase